MTTLLDEMGYNYTIFNAIDGRQVALSIGTLLDKIPVKV